VENVLGYGELDLGFEELVVEAVAGILFYVLGEAAEDSRTVVDIDL
jgi:multisubunit Na+/H+ antiporter MnhB subunit